VNTLSEKEDLVLEAFLDFLNAVEAGIEAARQRVKEQKSLWDPGKITWETAQGTKGEYERKGFGGSRWKVDSGRLFLLGFHER